MKAGRILTIFVDGLGLGRPNPAINPLIQGPCPTLRQLLAEHTTPIDPTLGVPGLPQSATGQTALLTGVNAAKHVGRHVEGFPGPELKKIIRAHNLYGQLNRIGRRSTFANAYYITDLHQVLQARVQSVTTVAALSGLGAVRGMDLLLRNEAVYQDLTRSLLRSRGYEGPLVTPEEAGTHLLTIAREHHFTLFEYFQTDRVGHRGDMSAAQQILGELDRFMAAVLTGTGADDLTILLTSDHGNIEDMSTGHHTLNAVPFTAVGPDATTLQQRVHSLTDIAPAIVAHLAASPE